MVVKVIFLFEIQLLQGNAMQDGIYHIRFSSSLGSSGEGLAVIKNGTLNGGDPGFVYAGTVTNSGTVVSGSLNIKCWNQAVPSVFGILQNFQLQLNGQSTGQNSFRVTGGTPSAPGVIITITGDFVSAAA